MDVHDFDLCVIGAGSAGFAAATTARRLGKSVAIAETHDRLAGLCILRGCMPSKTLLWSAEVAHRARLAPEAGIADGAQRDALMRLDGKLNARPVVERKRHIIDGFADERRQAIETFPLFRGSPAFAGRHELAVDGQTIRAKKLVIAAGSVIHTPELPGLRETGFVDSDDLLEMELLPREMIVLGGGAVACELAQYVARLGVKTTLLQRSATLLSSEDTDVGEVVRAALEQDGIEVVCGTHIVAVERAGERKRVVADVEGRRRTFEADEIFAALGRTPNLDGLNLAAAGVETSGAGLKVDDYLQTTNSDIFAAGDVIGDRELVHVAVHEGQLAVENAFSEKRRRARHEFHSARAVFTDPQVGIAGLTERECATRAIPYVASSYPYADHGKAITTGQTSGFVKMLAEPEHGRILGVAFVGAEGADLIHQAIALLYFNANVKDVMLMPHLHPTFAEIITYPAEDLCDRIEHCAFALVAP